MPLPPFVIPSIHYIYKNKITKKSGGSKKSLKKRTKSKKSLKKRTKSKKNTTNDIKKLSKIVKIKTYSSYN